MTGHRALALLRFKEEAVLARVLRSPPTLSSQVVVDVWKGGGGCTPLVVVVASNSYSS